MVVYIFWGIHLHVPWLTWSLRQGIVVIRKETSVLLGNHEIYIMARLYTLTLLLSKVKRVRSDPLCNPFILGHPMKA